MYKFGATNVQSPSSNARLPLWLVLLPCLAVFIMFLCLYCVLLGSQWVLGLISLALALWLVAPFVIAIYSSSGLNLEI